MSKLYKNIGLLQWSLIRLKFYIPVFILVQILLSIALIYGFSFLTGSGNEMSGSFLYTGSVTINIIALTCVLSPQIINDAKQNGIYDYLRTLPVSRFNIIIYDLLVWGIMAIPGVCASLIIGGIKFDLPIYVSTFGLLNTVFILLSMTLFGFSIAYLLSPNITALVTQVIMIGGLLFSPIIYPPSSLPFWIYNVHSFLPFVPVNRIIRFSLFKLDTLNVRDYLIVFVWGFISLVVSYYSLNRRK